PEGAQCSCIGSRHPNWRRVRRCDSGLGAAQTCTLPECLHKQPVVHSVPRFREAATASLFSGEASDMRILSSGSIKCMKARMRALDTLEMTCAEEALRKQITI